MTETAWDIHSCGYHCEIPACMKVQRTELLARLDAAELDAARYRWLREAESAAAQIMGYQADLDEWLVWITPEEADAAIDAAMKGKP